LGSGTTGAGNGLDNEITGNLLNNKLFGLAGDDDLDGAAGDDTLDGGKGADSLVGGTGSDTFIVDSIFDSVEELLADPGIDTVRSSVAFSLDAASGQVTGDVETLILTGNAAINATGSAAANTLIGNAAKNLLIGLNGNDTLNGGGGPDTLEGGAGNDTYFVASKSVQIREFGGDFGDAVVAGFNVDLNSTQFAELEFVTLTGNAALSATGTDARNSLIGNAGANKLTGGAGSDTLEGGNGNDTLDGGADEDFLFGGAGNDSYFVDSDNDAVKGEVAGGGVDTVSSSIVDFTLAEGLENLVLLAGGANGRGNSANNRMTGNDAENILVGSDGKDTLQGGGGADLLDGGTGKDAMNGGLGNDTYGVDDGDTITESVGGAAGGLDDVIYVGTIGHTLATNVENLILGAASGDSFGTGNALNNIITGNDGSNRLLGMAGDDTLLGGDFAIFNDIHNTLDGGAGADSLVGGGSFNDYFVDNSKDIVDASKGAFAFDTVHSSVSFDLRDNGVTVLGNVEYLVLTGAGAINGTGNGFDNIITGNGAANLIDGGAGGDELTGGGGNDKLFGGDDGDSLNGGAGADTMEGGASEDTYFVDNARDVILELAGTEFDVVLASINYTLPENFEQLDLIGNATVATGNAADNIVGANILSSKLSGLGGSDGLFGQNGADTLDGGIGNDTMAGRKGSDVYHVDSAGDVVDETSGGGIDTVIASVTYLLASPESADVENLTLASGKGDINGSGNGLNNLITGNEGQNNLDGEDGNDTILGGSNRDFLVGGAGNDSLNGGAGDDFFFGDIGDDTMIGGTGSDVFFYDSVLDGHDLIRGFDGNANGGQDVLDLETLFNDLGAGNEAERITRVQITDRGAAVDVWIDTDGNGSFDLFAATLQTSDAVVAGADISVGG
ncbi:MAG TPA: calcium-binding protein, partial [Verrucomicrobiae bacterium]|nr:calcium-binding protein [Verrucomicrobiae bacterium]